MRLKFVALPIAEIIWVPKNEQSLDTPTLPFLQNFNGLLFRWTLRMYWPNLKLTYNVLVETLNPTHSLTPNLKSVALSIPQIIAMKFWVVVANPQSWERRGRRGPG